MLKRVLRSRVNIALYQLLHRTWAFRSPLRLEALARVPGRSSARKRPAVARDRRAALRGGVRRGAHRPLSSSLERREHGREFLVLGDWITRFSYAVLERGQFRLETWPAREQGPARGRDAAPARTAPPARSGGVAELVVEGHESVVEVQCVERVARPDAERRRGVVRAPASLSAAPAPGAVSSAPTRPRPVRPRVKRPSTAPPRVSVGLSVAVYETPD